MTRTSPASPSRSTASAFPTRSAPPSPARLARNQILNNNLQETQAAAADALKLNHELTALYLSTFKDQGILTRLLMLPADVVKDASSFSIITSNDRKDVEKDLINKENEIEKRLAVIQAQNPKS
jgi:hypothetical protein